EIADIDHLLHFAEALGHDLAGLDGDQAAKAFLLGAQFIAEKADELSAHRGRDEPPDAKGIGGASDRRFGFDRIGAPDPGNELARDRRTDFMIALAQAFGRKAEPGEELRDIAGEAWAFLRLVHCWLQSIGPASSRAGGLQGETGFCERRYSQMGARNRQRLAGKIDMSFSLCFLHANVMSATVRKVFLIQCRRRKRARMHCVGSSPVAAEPGPMRVCFLLFSRSGMRPGSGADSSYVRSWFSCPLL